MHIASKAEMYQLYFRKRFGNMLRAWPGLAEYYASGYDKPTTLRYKGTMGGKWCAYNVPRDQVPFVIHQWEQEGADSALITVNESAPDDRLIFQGEVMRAETGLSVRYSTLPKPMRQALAERQHHVEGLAALTLLRHYMDPASLDDLHQLLDDFPDAVVEFSTWAQDIGDCPRRNTIFWEVRHY